MVLVRLDESEDAAEVLPCWAMLEVPGALGRLFGWIEETTVGGAAFLDVQFPKGHSRTLQNAHQVRSITVATEETVAKFTIWRDR